MGGQGRAHLLRGAHRLAPRPRAHRPAHHHRGGAQAQRPAALMQLALFPAPEENLPLREAIEFYQHEHGWTNRLIAGDRLLVMNSLLEKEGMAGQGADDLHRPALRHQVRLQLPALREQARREGRQGRRPDRRSRR